MIWEIAKQEFRSIYREGRFRTAAGLLSSLFILSLLGAYDYYASLKAQHDEAARTMREQWDNQKDKNPHSAAHYGTYVFKPIYPLSYFDRGVDAFTGNTLFLEGHRSNMAQFRAAEDQSDFARFGTLTPAFVLGMLMPLFIIILGFGSAAAERENGNLRLILAQGVRARSQFWGKSLGLWAAVLCLALPFFVAGAAGLLVASAGGEHWLRYACTVLLYLASFGCFIHLTLLISAWAGRQNVALVGALGGWVLACLIVPKAAVNVAKQLHPAPTWQAYNTAIKEDLKNGVDGHDGSDVYSKKLEAETLKKYGVDSVQHLPFNWDGFIMQKGEEHETYVFQKHKSQLLDVYQQQRQVHAAAAVFSPYVLTNILSQRLAGTDVDVYFDFLAAAEKYRVQLVGELNGDLTNNFKYGDWEGKRGKAFFAQNARFDYQPPSVRALLGSMTTPAGAMLIWLLVSGWLSVFFFNRLQPV
jgi:ABC-2 type transport system permease protein